MTFEGKNRKLLMFNFDPTRKVNVCIDSTMPGVVTVGGNILYIEHYTHALSVYGELRYRRQYGTTAILPFVDLTNEFKNKLNA